MVCVFIDVFIVSITKQLNMYSNNFNMYIPMFRTNCNYLIIRRKSRAWVTFLQFYRITIVWCRLCMHFNFLHEMYSYWIVDQRKMACCEETGLAASQTKYGYTFSKKIEWDWRLIVSQTVSVWSTQLYTLNTLLTEKIRAADQSLIISVRGLTSLCVCSVAAKPYAIMYPVARHRPKFLVSLFDYSLFEDGWAIEQSAETHTHVTDVNPSS